MPRVSASGIGGSGLDINSIVQQLVSLERRPIDAARLKQTGITAKLGSISSLRVGLAGLKSALDPLKNFNAFQGKSASSSDSNLLAAAAVPSAPSGVFTVNEVTQLAKAHTLQTASLFSSKTDAVGVGALTIKVGAAAGGQQKVTTIVIDEGQKNLQQIADKINAAESGVTASIVEVEEGKFRLLLQGKNTGAANPIRIEVQDQDGNNEDQSGLSVFRYTPSATPEDDRKNMAEVQAAQDALFRLDSVSFRRSTNTVADMIPGVTLTLLRETGVNAKLTVTVSPNVGSVRREIESFVSSYNRVIEELNRVQSFDKKTKQGGPLLGNEAARNIMNRIQSVAHGAVPGLAKGLASLIDIGIGTEKDGTLKINAEKLDQMLAKDALAVGRVFAGADDASDPNVGASRSGIADQMFNAVSDLLHIDRGTIAITEKGFRKSIAAIGEEIIRMERGADSFEKKTRDRFAKLEAALERISGAGSVLSRQISQLESLSGAIRRRGQGGSSSLSAR